jgi:hypothetical protein
MRSSSTTLILAAAILASPILDAEAGSIARQEDRMAPGTAHESNIVVGETPPASIVLESIDGESHDLAEVEGPLLLLFFRGTW